MPDFLYIHIPFCIRKCVYCDFLSFPFQASLAEKYVAALCRELVLRRDSAGSLKTVYIGGGTPSLLPEASFKLLFDTLRDNFTLSSSVEITVEANPGAMNAPKLDTFLALGINRISLGIQSFDDTELNTLGRIHTAAEAVTAVNLIKNSGLKNFSLDVMYGIPGQTMETWKETTAKIVAFSPPHISSYELTPEEKTPLFGYLRTGQLVMPEEETILGMYGHAIDLFTFNGLEHYEISNFALPGFRSIHNLNYWDRGEYVGAGAGAHSFMNNIRSKNSGEPEKYINMLDTGILPEEESYRVSPSDALKEFLFLGLRKTEGISLSRAEELGLDIAGASKDLVKDGFLEVSGGHIRLTGKGIAVSNTVIVCLYERAGL